jgi:PleD family two-component response regulator
MTHDHSAISDSVTGLGSWRGMDRKIADHIARVKQQKIPLSCIMLDIQSHPFFWAPFYLIGSEK